MKMPPAEPTLIQGWGRVGVVGTELFPTNLEQAARNAVLTRGLGRSYGDSSLPPSGNHIVVATPHANRILNFDEDSGRIRVEAGVSLLDLNRTLLPRGWFTPVTPGTQYVTVGGMVAADVHGKNHHRDGCFGEHVTGLRMMLANNSIVDCSPEIEPDLFWATVGGMGLTGHLLEVEFTLTRVETPWIVCESKKIENVDDYIDALKESATDWPYTVGWIDCLSKGDRTGRGVLQRGRFAKTGEAPPHLPPLKRRLSVPFTCPSWLLGRATVSVFNATYFARHHKNFHRKILHPESFFYPLDSLLHWNRLYGRKGFTQYQCVLPDSAGRGAARRFLGRLTRMGGASFLCVIKDCGDEGRGMLSFPMRGISIAVDLPIRRNTQSLVDHLNELIVTEGGRIYLAKDQFTRPEHFRKMEPRLDDWLAVRRRYDSENTIRSAQSVRLFGDRP